MKNKKLDGTAIKLIAIFCMLIDHIGAAIIENGVMEGALPRSPFLTIDLFLRGIGRIAFPIFCYTLVEGFTYTHNKAKYLGRLVLFCAISEVPFDAAFSMKFIDNGHQNVFFTLALGLMAMIVLDWGENQIANKWILGLFDFMITFGFMGLAEVLATDYSACGVLAILSIYFLRKIPILAIVAPTLVLVLFYQWIEAPAALSIPILLCYNHQKGKGLKYFFYAFYPLHLALLYILLYFVVLQK